MADEALKTSEAPAPSADPAPQAADNSAPEPVTGLGAEAAAPDPAPEAPPLDRTAEGSESPDADPEITKLGDTDDDSRKVQLQADWPDDWREKMARGDEKLMKRLERFASPDKVLNSWLAAEQKISSGEYKKEVDANASPEELAAYRQEHGIPESPDGYKLPEGHDWNEEDQRMFGKIFESMHGANATQEQINALASGYNELVQEIMSDRKQADREFIQQQEDILRARLGDDYRNKLNIYERALEHPESPIPQAIREKLQGARYEDGSQIVNDAEFATWVIEMGLDTWGEGAMRTGEAATIQTRVNEIQQIMRTDFDRYIREGLDREYSRILERQAGRRPQMGGSDYAYDD